MNKAREALKQPGCLSSTQAANLEMMLTDKNNKIRTLMAENAALESRLNAILVDNSKLKETCEDTQTLLSMKNETANTFMNQVKKLQAENGNLTNRLMSVNDTVRRLRGQLHPMDIPESQHPASPHNTKATESPKPIEEPTCCVCNWVNVGLRSVGAPGNPQKFICENCLYPITNPTESPKQLSVNEQINQATLPKLGQFVMHEHLGKKVPAIVLGESEEPGSINLYVLCRSQVNDHPFFAYKCRRDQWEWPQGKSL